jgi:ABC-type multidrug transport system fused ATPase/permease subunit
MDYDRVLVLGDGDILEFDAPRKLIQNEGHFYKMCRASADWGILSATYNK